MNFLSGLEGMSGGCGCSGTSNQAPAANPAALRGIGSTDQQSDGHGPVIVFSVLIGIGTLAWLTRSKGKKT